MNCNLKENAKQDQESKTLSVLECTTCFFYLNCAFSSFFVPLKGNSFNNSSCFIVDQFQVNPFKDYQG